MLLSYVYDHGPAAAQMPVGIPLAGLQDQK